MDMSDDKNSVRRQALRLIAADGHRVGTRLAQAGGVSRQMANAHLQVLVREAWSKPKAPRALASTG
jgi:hypothetical protein